MRIVELKAENFKRLVAVAITPKGDVIIISGKNRAGKTCALDIMWAALGGAKGIPKEPIRKGQDRAVIEVDLGEYKATRVFTKKGNYLTVENKEGMVFKSPEALLDRMIGDLTFDPREFATAKNRDEILLSLVGLKGVFEKIQVEMDALYTERTVINRQAKQVEGQLKGYNYEVEYDGPTADKPVQELINQLQEARVQGERKSEKAYDVQKIETNIRSYLSEIAEAEKQIKKYKSVLVELNTDLETATKELNEIEIPDTVEIENKINARVKDNEKARVWREYEGIRDTYEDLKHESDVLSVKLEKRRLQKKKAIEDAEFPIEGLTYDEGIYYNGIPFEQISESEKLRVSMSVAMALNPQVRVIRITDGSLLDSENMKVIKELAKEKDYQIWIEKVDETGKVGIYIEEGEVKAVNE